MKRVKIFIIIILIVSLTACMKYEYKPDEYPDVVSKLEVSILFVNVGKADAIIVKIDEKAYMIDTGEKSSVPSVYSAVSYLGINEFEGIFLTHTHSDHIGGFDTLVDIFEVKKLYSAEISMGKKNGENKIEELALKNGVEHNKLIAGDKIEVYDNVFFKVLGPVEYNDKDDNDNSLVMKLFVNGKTVLFTGDMQKSEEYTLMDRKVDLRADILKVGNHGNQDATTKKFANAVDPNISIISTDTTVDTNSAHHKVKEYLSKSDIYVTEEFDIGVHVVISKGGSIKIENPKRVEGNRNISIEDVNRENQTVTFKNTGEVADISGYFLYSSKGSEIFVFPEKTIVNANSTFTVSCIGYEGDFIWNEKNVWKKDDSAILYNNFGFALSNY